MDGAYSTHVSEDKCTHNFKGGFEGKDITWKAGE